MGHSSVFLGHSSLHSDSLPLLGLKKEPASSQNRMNKLFNGLKSICKSNDEMNDLRVITTPKTNK
jgi:hypothetical protein